jgi:RecA-family ATPase
MKMNDKSNILAALDKINVADLSYQEWINVGMGLQNEGFDSSVWDTWSQNDTRYKKGECDRKWRSFRSCPSPITGGTICQMAMERGWEPRGNMIMEWDDEIQYDGDDFTQYAAPVEWDPVDDFRTYLETLFEPEDRIGYVTNDVWQDSENKWLPSKGVYDRTVGELLASLEKHPDDLGATIGDWKSDAGAWIRFNPVDGKGVRNDNITKFRYALVESDTMSIADQDAVIRKLELPVACLVHSGGKSLHAIVRVDAGDYTEYRKRVEFLYDFLEKNGVDVDKQNRNPSRLSRLPGATRNGNRQYLVATNIGRKSWVDWMDFVEGVSDELPDLVMLSDIEKDPPQPPEELITGILRRGHKMLISGSSKAGKSFLLMELCIALAEGAPWLGFPCKKSRVLYVNLEIDPASCYQRFLKIYDALKQPRKHSRDIAIWNLRGNAVPLDKLVPKLVRRVRDQHFDAIVIDPIYKVITGDENNASEMAAFCNQFDKICADTGCATIYCHHHSKGAQGAKRAMDRASGSGVFARDPDAQLDMIQLDLSDDMRNNLQDGNATAWRLESSLREFENIRPVNFWFAYPIHRVDDKGNLRDAFAEGSADANLSKSGKRTSPNSRFEALHGAYSALSLLPSITVKDLAEYMGKSEKSVRRYIDEFSFEFTCEKGIVKRAQID